MVPILATLELAVASDLVRHPDNQTAWIQQNNAFESGEKPSDAHWVVTPNIKVTPGKSGLQINAGYAGKGNPYNMIRRMPFDPAFPWLQFDISDAVNLEGFRIFSLHFGGLGTHWRGIRARLPEGRYVTRVTPAVGKEDVEEFLLRMDISGSHFVLSDLCMKKDPLPRIESHPVDATKKIAEIGDEIKVTVYLATPAEDVSVQVLNRFFATPLKIGSQGTLQLKPEDPEGKIWSAKFVLQQMQVYPLPKGKPVEPSHLMLRANILGGKFPKPLLTWIETPWDVNR